jgi:hypothetical protein
MRYAIQVVPDYQATAITVFRIAFGLPPTTDNTS